MSLVNGKYSNLAFWNMGVWKAVISFELSAPATETGTGEKWLISSTKRHSATVNPESGDWSMFVFSTEAMPQDRFYRVRATYLDGEDNPIGFEEFPWEIRVPEGVWDFNDLIRDWSSPLAVGISLTPPDLLPAYWLNPATGDLSRKKA